MFLNSNQNRKKIKLNIIVKYYNFLLFFFIIFFFLLVPPIHPTYLFSIDLICRNFSLMYVAPINLSWFPTPRTHLKVPKIQQIQFVFYQFSFKEKQFYRKKFKNFTSSRRKASKLTYLSANFLNLAITYYESAC